MKWLRNHILFFKRLVEVMRLGFLIYFKRYIHTTEGKVKFTNPVRLRIFFEKSGGGFIKFGQILSLRQDFLPFEYVIELLRLLSRVPEVSFDKMEMVFAEDTGKSIEAFFSEFNPRPIASASIGQVYEARLRNSPGGEAGGEKVAVKIQKPGVVDVFESDFKLMMFFAKIIDFFRIFSTIHATELVSEFINWTRKELDFTFEAKNGEIFYQNRDNYPRTVIPKQYIELSTPRVLIQELIEGEISVEKIILNKINKDTLTERGIDIDEMVYYLILSEMKQYFIDCFFHADPHPANLAFLPGNKIAYFDFGIVGNAGQHRLLFLKTLLGVAKKDSYYLANHFLEFGQDVMEEDLRLYLQAEPYKKVAYRKIFDKIKNLISIEFTEDIKNIMDSWFVIVENPNSSLKDKSIAPVFFKIIERAEKYGVHLPRDIILFFRAFFILDMVALQLSPKFDIIKALNIFFNNYPIEILGRVINGEEQKEKVADAEIPTDMGTDWELFREIIVFEKEKKMAAKEAMIDMVVFYSEKYDEVKSMLKTIR